MTVLLLYDHTTNSFERHSRSFLPYLMHGRILTRAFLGYADTDLAWTDLRLLKAYDALCEANGARVYVGGGFKRVSSGLHPGHSAHYAGLALHMGQGTQKEERERLRALCTQTRAFHYVEPEHRAPVWVHAEISVAPSCRLTPGYPCLERGMCGVHVLVLQDALLCCGYSAALTGTFDASTARSLLRFRLHEGLPPLERADAALWNRLLARAKENAPKTDV